MAHLLIRWLWDEVGVPAAFPINPDKHELDERGFANGYWLAYVLYLLNQLPEFDPKRWPNNEHGETKVHNFSKVEPVLRRLGIKFDSERAKNIMHEKKDEITHLLYQIRNATSPLQPTTGIPNTAPMGSTHESIRKRTRAPAKRAQTNFDTATHNIFVRQLTRAVGNQNDMYLEQVLFKHKEDKRRVKEQLELARKDDLANEQARKHQFREERRNVLHRNRQMADQRSHEEALQWQRNLETRLAQKIYSRDIDDRIRQSRCEEEEEHVSKEAHHTYSSLEEFDSKLATQFQGIHRKSISSKEQEIEPENNLVHAEAVTHRLRRRKAVKRRELANISRRRASYLVAARRERTNLHAAQRLEQWKRFLCKHCSREFSLADMARCIRKHENVFRDNRVSRTELIAAFQTKSSSHIVSAHSALAERRNEEHEVDWHESVSRIKTSSSKRQTVNRERIKDMCKAIVEDVSGLATEAAIIRNIDGADVRATTISVTESARSVESNLPPLELPTETEDKQTRPSSKSSQARRTSVSATEPANPFASLYQCETSVLSDFKQSLCFSVVRDMLSLPQIAIDGSGEQFWRELMQFFGRNDRPSYHVVKAFCENVELPVLSDLGIEDAPPDMDKSTKGKGSKPKKGADNTDTKKNVERIQKEAKRWVLSKLESCSLPSDSIVVASLGLDVSDVDPSSKNTQCSLCIEMYEQRLRPWNPQNNLNFLVQYADLSTDELVTDEFLFVANNFLGISEASASKLVDENIGYAEHVFATVLRRFANLKPVSECHGSSGTTQGRLPDFTYTASVLGPPGFGVANYVSHVSEMFNLCRISPDELLSTCLKIAAGQDCPMWTGKHEAVVKQLGHLYMAETVFEPSLETADIDNFSVSVEVSLILVYMSLQFGVSLDSLPFKQCGFHPFVQKRMEEALLDTDVSDEAHPVKNCNGWILENFPRTVKQAEILEKALRVCIIGTNGGEGLKAKCDDVENCMPRFSMARTDDDKPEDRLTYSVNSDEKLLQSSNSIFLNEFQSKEDFTKAFMETSIPKPSYAWTIKHVIRLVLPPQRVLRWHCGNRVSDTDWSHMDFFPPFHTEDTYKTSYHDADTAAHMKCMHVLSEKTSSLSPSSIDDSYVLGCFGYGVGPFAMDSYAWNERELDAWFCESSTNRVHRVMLWKATAGSNTTEESIVSQAKQQVSSGNPVYVPGGVYSTRGQLIDQSLQWPEYASQEAWKDGRFDILDPVETMTVLSKIVKHGISESERICQMRADCFEKSSRDRLGTVMDQCLTLMKMKSERAGYSLVATANLKEDGAPESPKSRDIGSMIPPPLPCVQSSTDEEETSERSWTPVDSLPFSSVTRPSWNSAVDRALAISSLCSSVWNKFSEYYTKKRNSCLNVLQHEEYSSRYRLKKVTERVRHCIGDRWSGYERVMRYAQGEINRFSLEERQHKSDEQKLSDVNIGSIRKVAEDSADKTSPDEVIQYLHDVVGTARIAMQSGVWAKREYLSVIIGSYLRDCWLSYVETSVLSYASELLEIELEKLLMSRSLLVAYYKCAEGGTKSEDIFNSVWKYAKEKTSDSKTSKPKKSKSKSDTQQGDGMELAEESDDEDFADLHELHKKVDIPCLLFKQENFPEESETSENNTEEKTNADKTESKTKFEPALGLSISKCNLIIPLRYEQRSEDSNEGQATEQACKWFEHDEDEGERRIREDLSNWLSSPTTPDISCESSVQQLINLVSRTAGADVGCPKNGSGLDDGVLSALARCQTQLWISHLKSQDSGETAGKKDSKGAKGGKKGPVSDASTVRGIQQKLMEAWAQSESWRESQAPAKSDDSWKQFVQLLKQCGGYVEDIVKLADTYKKERKKNQLRMEAKLKASLEQQRKEAEEAQEQPESTGRKSARGKKSAKGQKGKSSEEESPYPLPDETFLFLDDSLLDAIACLCREFVKTAKYIAETVSGLCQQIRAYYNQTFHNIIAESELALAEELGAIDKFTTYARQAIDNKIRLPFALGFSKPHKELNLARSFYCKSFLSCKYPAFVQDFLKTHFEVALCKRVLASPLDFPPQPKIKHDRDSGEIRPDATNLLNLSEKFRVCSILQSGKGVNYSLETLEPRSGSKKGRGGKNSSGANENDEASKPRFLSSEVYEAAQSCGKVWPDVGPAGPFFGRAYQEEELLDKIFDTPPTGPKCEHSTESEGKEKQPEVKPKAGKNASKKSPRTTDNNQGNAETLSSVLAAEADRISGEIIPAGYVVPRNDFFSILRESAEDGSLPPGWDEIPDEALMRLADLFAVNIDSFHGVEERTVSEPATYNQKRSEYAQWQEQEVIKQLKDAEKKEEELEEEEADRLGIPVVEVRRRQGKATGADVINLSEFCENSRPWLMDAMEYSEVPEVESEEDEIIGVSHGAAEPFYYSSLFAQLCPGPLEWRLRYCDPNNMERISKHVQYHPLWHLQNTKVSEPVRWFNEKVPIDVREEGFGMSGESTFNGTACLETEEKRGFSHGCQWTSSQVIRVSILAEAIQDSEESEADHEADSRKCPRDTSDSPRENFFRILYPRIDFRKLIDWRKFIMWLLITGPCPSVTKRILDEHFPKRKKKPVRLSLKHKAPCSDPFALPLDQVYRDDLEVKRLYEVPNVEDFSRLIGYAWSASRWPTSSEISELKETHTSLIKDENGEVKLDMNAVQNNFSSDNEDSLHQKLSVYRDENWLRHLGKYLCSWQSEAPVSLPEGATSQMKILESMFEKVSPWFASQNLETKTSDQIAIDSQKGMTKLQTEFGIDAELFERCSSNIKWQVLDAMDEVNLTWPHLLDGHDTIGSIVAKDFSEIADQYRELEQAEIRRFTELADRNTHTSVSYGDAQVASILFLYLSDNSESIRWDWLEKMFTEHERIRNELEPPKGSAKHFRGIVAESDRKILSDMYGWLTRLRSVGKFRAKAQKVRRRRRLREQQSMQQEDELSEHLRNAQTDQKKKKKGAKK